jgi:hypothetical protein
MEGQSEGGRERERGKVYVICREVMSFIQPREEGGREERGRGWMLYSLISQG